MASSKTTKPTDVGTVRQAIGQARPFRSVSQEAVIALVMTTEKVGWPYEQLFAGQGLTRQQYNVLRILRGAGKAGLPTLEIAARMVERTPGITRLLDRLEAKGLCERRRSAEDRRQVMCHVTKAGLDLLARLDRPVDELDDTTFAALSATELRQLIKLLDKVRVAAT